MHLDLITKLLLVILIDFILYNELLCMRNYYVNFVCIENHLRQYTLEQIMHSLTLSQRV
jgi:hypothetical protein